MTMLQVIIVLVLLRKYLVLIQLLVTVAVMTQKAVILALASISATVRKTAKANIKAQYKRNLGYL
jgi:hypothetical protein